MDLYLRIDYYIIKLYCKCTEKKINTYINKLKVKFKDFSESMFEIKDLSMVNKIIKKN